jgi:hypothetical protein
MKASKLDNAIAHIGCTIFVVAWAVALTSLMVTCGCGGASAMRTQAQAAYATGAVIREARTTIDGRLSEALGECVQQARPAPALACVDRVEAEYRPIVHAHGAAVDAHQAWALALLAAVDERDGLDTATALDLVAAVLRAYSGAREAAADIGIQLPALPEVSP